MDIVDFFKRLYKTFTFAENVKAIDNGDLSVEYNLSGNYILIIRDFKSDMNFNIYEDKDFKKVYEYGMNLPHNFPNDDISL